MRSYSTVDSVPNTWDTKNELLNQQLDYCNSSAYQRGQISLVTTSSVAGVGETLLQVADQASKPKETVADG